MRNMEPRGTVSADSNCGGNWSTGASCFYAQLADCLVLSLLVSDTLILQLGTDQVARDCHLKLDAPENHSGHLPRMDTHLLYQVSADIGDNVSEHHYKHHYKQLHGLMTRPEDVKQKEPPCSTLPGLLVLLLKHHANGKCKQKKRTEFSHEKHQSRSCGQGPSFWHMQKEMGGTLHPFHLSCLHTGDTVQGP